MLKHLVASGCAVHLGCARSCSEGVRHGVRLPNLPRASFRLRLVLVSFRCLFTNICFLSFLGGGEGARETSFVCV